MLRLHAYLMLVYLRVVDVGGMKPMIYRTFEEVWLSSEEFCIWKGLDRILVLLKLKKPQAHDVANQQKELENYA